MCALSNGVVLRQSSMIIESVKYPVLTEKSVRLMDANQYTFDVDLKLTKPQIKALIEELFQVKVTAVNTHRPPRKKETSWIHARLQNFVQESYCEHQTWSIYSISTNCLIRQPRQKLNGGIDTTLGRADKVH